MDSDKRYREFFNKAMGWDECDPQRGPYPYQVRLATDPTFPELLDIPTGFGKTAAIVLAWLWRRRFDDRFKKDTPRRLVYCLPMRVLVEQTQKNICEWLLRVDRPSEPENKVFVHQLMGGEDDLKSWAEYPEKDMILIGTQDMLLSRALMRGYGMSRYQWPIHFALLHNDALWVFDEVQLMGPGLATSAQLEAFRNMSDFPLAKRSKSLWISATLNKDWLGTVDFASHIARCEPFRLSEEEKKGKAIRDRRESIKRVDRADVKLTEDNVKGGAKEYAHEVVSEILRKHQPGTQTLVIVNTVDRAQAVYQAIRSAENSPESLLVHSRFRPVDRTRINAALGDCPDSGRIIVATQAIEAGVDITSCTLFTELAPWSSLVQRFGRCNRSGEWNDKGGADVYWIDVTEPSPYESEALEDARSKLVTLASASPKDLPATDQTAPLVPVIRKRDFLDLFNTEPDLTGFDVDISPYIRDADDTDVFLFWRHIETGDPEGQPRPTAEEICRAGISKAKGFLNKHKNDCFYWDGLDRKWRKLGDRNVYPGMTVMVEAAVGGYDADLGFDPTGKTKAVTVMAPPSGLAKPEDAIDEDQASILQYAVELGEHLCHVEDEVAALCDAVGETQYKATAKRAGRWHDVGKAHEAFHNMLRNADPSLAPNRFWAKSGGTYKGRARYTVANPPDGYTERKHFRHELASMLAWLEQHGQEPDADLIAYLILAHHGKVRTLLRSLPNETEPPDANATLFARGVWQGDELPGFAIQDREAVVPTILRLDLMRLGRGPMDDSWTARTQRLLKDHGPFRLSWLETLIRLADWRASRKEQLEAQKKEADNAKHELETSDTTMAGIVAGGKGPAPLGTDSPERGGEHGLRGGAGGTEVPASGTRPSHATRHIETTLGILSYAELAPHLGHKVRLLEEDIESGKFDDRDLDDSLIGELHTAICGDLVPQMIGFRRVDVTVGAHTPPAWHHVPPLVRDYAHDLQARLRSISQGADDLLVEALAFAEGRLLFIHPFTDFNGRVTRVFLRLILRRLDLAPVKLVPDENALPKYLAALSEADRSNWRPLMDIWRIRFEMPNIIHLTGCAPTPLAHYLKALGILRLVAEQKDENACGYWQGEHFVLESTLDEQAFLDFLLHEYSPTPILSPWNGRAGFLEGEDGEGSDRRGAVLLRTFKNSLATRLSNYRTLIAALDGVKQLQEMNAVRTEKKELEKRKKEQPQSWIDADQTRLTSATKRQAFIKDNLFVLLRNALRDDLLAWLDSAVAIGSERAFAPLLGGSGGAEGSMDLGVNFMDNILLLFSPNDESGAPSSESLSWLKNALFGNPARLTVANTAGSLSPGCVGGANATSGFTRDLPINPWDYILMFEGALVFRPTLTRKLESSAGSSLGYPFTVEPASAGAGGITIDDEKKTRSGKSEIWAPLWTNAMSHHEVLAFFREGSLTLGKKHPTHGLDMARCVAQLGMDRGIGSFQRFIFFTRSGDNDLAVPLSRVEVSRTVAVDLITDLDQRDYLKNLRRAARDKDAPNSLKDAIAQLENSLFAITSSTHGKQTVQECLIGLGEVLWVLAKSGKGQKAVPMLPRLSAGWVLQADDGSHEFRIATALAGIWAKDLPMRVNLLPVSADGKTWIKANDARRSLCVWGEGALERNLLAVLRRRLMEAERRGLDRKPFHSALNADSAAVAAFLRRETNDDRIARLLVALSFAEMPDALPRRGVEMDNDLPAAYAILKPLFVDDGTLNWMRLLPEGRNLPLSQTIPNLLGAGRVDDAVCAAWRRQRASGLHLPRGRTAPPASLGIDGPRLAAALMIPLPISDLNRLFVHLTRDETEEIPE